MRGLLLFSLLGLYSFHVYTGVEYKTATKVSFALIASVFIFLSTANRVASEGLAAFEGLVSNIMGRNLIEIGKGAHIHIAADDLDILLEGRSLTHCSFIYPVSFIRKKKLFRRILTLEWRSLVARFMALVRSRRAFLVRRFFHSIGRALLS